MKVKKILKFNRKKKRRNKSKVVDAVPPVLEARITTFSLGVGTFSPDLNYLTEFIPSDAASTAASTRTFCSTLGDVHQRRKTFKQILSSEKLFENIEHISERIPATFERIKSSFIRVADLGTILPVKGRIPNFHHASQDPPPGVEHDPMEQWVALDDGEGSHAPIAPYAIAALAEFGYKTLFDESMWKAEGKTDKILKGCPAWGDASWKEGGGIHLPSASYEEEVLVWSGNFIHGLYGSDLPAIRAAGIVNMSPRALMELLVDSNRTQEYNKMSLGRTDLIVLQDDLQTEGPFGKSITKVMRSESQPPLIRRPLQFVSILHARQLEDESGYIIVSRAVTQSPQGTFEGLRSEILMGVNVIRSVEGDENRCLMINVNHLKTPMIPLFLGKKLGLAAAPGFIHDLRALA